MEQCVEEFKLFAKPATDQLPDQSLSQRQASHSEQPDQSFLDRYKLVSESGVSPSRLSKNIMNIKDVGMAQVQSVFKDVSRSIKAVSLIPTVLNQVGQGQRIEVYVFDPLVEQQKKNLIKTTQSLTFKVQTPKLQADVRRADSDFMFLHAYLSRQYPHVLLPPMPYCKRASTEPRKLHKRTRIYDRYLKQMLRYQGSEELRSDYMLVQFLTQQDRKEFDNIVKQYSTATGIQYGVPPVSRD